MIWRKMDGIAFLMKCNQKILKPMKEWFTWKIRRGGIVNKQEKEILKYLEQSYSGAKMMNDESCQIRLARAIAAFNSDPEVSAFALFTNKFITEYCTEWGEVHRCQE